MAEQLQPQVLKGLHRYLWCFMVVQFDVDVGPDLKLMRPSTLPNDIKFTEDDFRTICFSALPERTLPSSVSQFYMISFEPSDAPGSIVHGFILFHQKEDITKTRKYTQESLVIISQYRFPEFFRNCLDIIAGCNDFVLLSIDHKIPILDSAINIISNWPDPNVGPLELGLLGNVLNFIIPTNTATPLVDSHYVTCPVERWDDVISRLTTNDSKKRFFTYVIDQLYMLYEYLVLEIPSTCIIVYSGFPHVVSLFIDLATDLIRPLPLSANRIFEYITIHSDITKLVTGRAGGIYGVTNPLLLNNLVNNSAGIRPIIISLDNGSNEIGARLHSQIKSSNRNIKKDRLLLPNSKFAFEIIQAEDIHSRIRLHFATLSSRLLAPISEHLRHRVSDSTNSVNNLEFDIESFDVNLLTTAQGLNTGDNSFDRNLFTTPFFSTYSGFWKFGESSKQAAIEEISMVKFYRQFTRSQCFNDWLELKKTLDGTKT